MIVIRNDRDYHEKVVADVFERLLARDDIYLGYSGWYSESDEEFFTEASWQKSPLRNGKVLWNCAIWT